MSWVKRLHTKILCQLLRKEKVLFTVHIFSLFDNKITRNWWKLDNNEICVNRENYADFIFMISDNQARLAVLHSITFTLPSFLSLSHYITVFLTSLPETQFFFSLSFAVCLFVCLFVYLFFSRYSHLCHADISNTLIATSVYHYKLCLFVPHSIYCARERER
jgi:hypothetical protein